MVNRIVGCNGEKWKGERPDDVNFARPNMLSFGMLHGPWTSHYDRHKIHTKGVGKGGSGGGGLLSSCYYVYKHAVTAKGCPKFRKAREEKTAVKL